MIVARQYFWVWSIASWRLIWRQPENVGAGAPFRTTLTVIGPLWLYEAHGNETP